MLLIAVIAVIVAVKYAVSAHRCKAPLGQGIAHAIVLISGRRVHDENTNMGLAQHVGRRPAQARSIDVGLAAAV